MAQPNQRNKINWRSRIVSTGKIKASQVTPHPQNPRRHPQFQRDVVAASFDELGQIAPVIINSNNGYLVDGEERSWLALSQGDDTELDVIYVDLTDEEHLKALAYFDASTNLATYDAQVFEDILHQINTDSPALQQLLSDVAEAAGMLLGEGSWQDAFGKVPEGDKSAYQQMTFTLHDEQARVVASALKQAMVNGAVSEVNENSNGNALTLICQRFLDVS